MPLADQTVAAWLQAATGRLMTAGIGSARLDCLILLEDIAGHDRGWLLAHPEHTLTNTMITKLGQQLNRREQHIPLAYIRGGAEFYGHWFVLDEHVLVPRPESEVMLELLRTIIVDTKTALVDVGTGSGALAISAKLSCSDDLTVLATDIDQQCLRVARNNAERLGATVEFTQADLLQAGSAHSYGWLAGYRQLVLLANLPYIPNDYAINRAASHEPALALFAGPDGLDAYRDFWRQCSQLPIPPQHVITESLEPQHTALAELARSAGYQLKASLGLAQHFTLTTARPRLASAAHLT